MNGRQTPIERTAVSIPVEGVVLHGDLALPSEPCGIVLFAHGSGSSRHSPRNQYVAGFLNERSLGTLLVDLLTAEEERDDDLTLRWRFEIDLLARRLTGIAGWLSNLSEANGGVSLGLFGASTGAAAALITAARCSETVRAVVSRGGRPDLAASTICLVRAPTLLIVGGEDKPVLELNRQAKALLKCKAELKIIPGATHLFEEPGALEEVATLAADWFTAHFPEKSGTAGHS